MFDKKVVDGARKLLENLSLKESAVLDSVVHGEVTVCPGAPMRDGFTGNMTFEYLKSRAVPTSCTAAAKYLLSIGFIEIKNQKVVLSDVLTQLINSSGEQNADK